MASEVRQKTCKKPTEFLYVLHNRGDMSRWRLDIVIKSYDKKLWSAHHKMLSLLRYVHREHLILDGVNCPASSITNIEIWVNSFWVIWLFRGFLCFLPWFLVKMITLLDGSTYPFKTRHYDNLRPIGQSFKLYEDSDNFLEIKSSKICQMKAAKVVFNYFSRIWFFPEITNFSYIFDFTNKKFFDL